MTRYQSMATVNVLPLSLAVGYDEDCIVRLMAFTLTLILTDLITLSVNMTRNSGYRDQVVLVIGAPARVLAL